jgi:hypothetical protein
MNILDTAQEFYKKTPLPQVQDQRRKMHTKELLFVIETAPFLSPTEKKQISMLIPLYPTRVIRQVRRRLIEQGIVFLKLNPKFKDSMQTWLNQVNEQQTTR